MKKILAFLMAVTTCFCTFTACGDNNDSDDDKSNKSTSSEKDDDKDDKDDEEDDKDKEDKEDEDKDKDKEDEDKKKDDKDKDDEEETTVDEDEEETTVDEDEEEETTVDEDEDEDKDKEDDKNSGSGSASDEEYLEVFTEFYEKAADKDTAGLMNLTFPQILIDALIETNAYDFMVEEIDGSYGELSSADLSKIDISSVTDCDAATVEKLEKLYSVYSNLFIVMAENDISYDDMEAGNIDEAKTLLILEPAMQLAQLDDIENLDVEIVVPFEEAKYVTLTAEGVDQKFVMYRVEGDDWKIDTIGLAMFGF
ncbi:MAG: hypothetical protein IKK91_06285 [Ruminococcus sp.]|nr:hypothetical protein [Ruminococcus sp.]